MLEVELKFPVESFEEMEERLAGLGCAPGEPQDERNMLLDLHGAPLASRDIVFRLRNHPGGTLLTVKTPLPATGLKVRREREAVMDVPPERALELFSLIGYGVVTEYRKRRRECRLEAVTVCLDELDIGRFVELEAGSGEELRRAAELLGLDPSDGTRLSYPALIAASRDSG